MTYWTKVLNGRINRRRAMGLVGGSAAAAAFLAACGGDDDEPASGGSSGGGSSDKIKRGGHLRLGLPNDITVVDPHISAFSNQPTLYPLMEGLIDYDDKLEVQPLLATEWELSDGGATVRLKLREGVTFHSGREFTSEDVAWNMARVRTPSLPYPQYKLMADWFPTVETPDKHTIVLKGASPRASTFDFLFRLGIADPVHMEGPHPESAIVGTGPWKWVEWKQGISFEVAKNPDHWGKDGPYLDGYTWMVALDDQTLQAQFDAGDLDYIADISIPGFARYRDDSDVQALIHPFAGRFNMHGFNCTDKPFNDARVRRAFNWAFDRQRFTDLVLQGTEEPASLPWPEQSPAYDAKQNQRYKFDLDEASKLLRAAGATDLSTTLYTRIGQPDNISMAPIWQRDLASIGVKAKIENNDAAAFTSILRGRDFHSVFLAQNSNASLGSPATLFAFGTQNWSGHGDSNTGYLNPQLEELVAKALVELDTKKARALYLEWNELILQESFQIVPSMASPRSAAKSNLMNIGLNPNGYFYFTKSWLA